MSLARQLAALEWQGVGNGDRFCIKCSAWESRGTHGKSCPMPDTVDAIRDALTQAERKAAAE